MSPADGANTGDSPGYAAPDTIADGVLAEGPHSGASPAPDAAPAAAARRMQDVAALR